MFVILDEVDKKLEKMCSYSDPDAEWKIKIGLEKAEKANNRSKMRWLNRWDGTKPIYKKTVLNSYNGKRVQYEIPIGMKNAVLSYLHTLGGVRLINNQFLKDGSRLTDTDIAVRVEPRDENQENAFQAIHRENGTGIIEAATGFGKSAIGIHAIQSLQSPTLITATVSKIISQWAGHIMKFFNYNAATSGSFWMFYSDDEHYTYKQLLDHPEKIKIMIATPSLLYKSIFMPNGKTTKKRNECINTWLADYCDYLIVDEVHDASADQYIAVLDSLTMYRRLGMSATVMTRSDNKDLEYVARVGSIIYTFMINQKYGAQTIPLKFLKAPHMPTSRRTRYEDIYQKAIIANVQRNNKVVEAIDDCMDEDRIVLVLVEKIDHARRISEMSGFPYTSSGDPARKQKFEDFHSGDIPVLICTYKLVGKGYDYPALDTIILAGAGRGFNQNVQAVGRAYREYEGKNIPKVFDFADTTGVLRDQTLERLDIWISQEIYKIDARDTFIAGYLR
jgi:superfamily II DNA or RNA helicase